MSDSAGLPARIQDALDRRSGALDAGAVARLVGDLDPRALGPATEERLLDLAAVFGLTELDRLLLTAAVAAELDPSFARAYALLQADPAALRPSVALALELSGSAAHDPQARSRLAPGAPLRMFDLLEVVGDAPLPTRVLRVPDRVTGHLAGEERLDPLAERMILASVPVATDASRQLTDVLRAGRPLVWITTPPGSAGLALAAAAFDGLDVAALAVDLTRRPSDVSTADALRVVLREAALLRSGLILQSAEAIVTESGPAQLRWLERSPVPVIALSSRGWDADWTATVPHLATAEPLERAAREQLWRNHSGVDPVLDPDGWEALLGLRLAPEQIVRAARYARSAEPAGGPVGVHALSDAARTVGGGAVQGAVAHRPTQSFDDLVLPAATLRPIREIVQWAKHREVVLAQGPVAGKYSRGRGITALFTGSAGTGKTLAAHVVASELGLDLQTIDLSVVVDKYIGETEKRLEQVLTAAENLNAVLLFDEADALFGSRSEVRDSRDRYANQEVAYLLQRIEQFSGIAILTSNLPGAIDTAFARRLNFIVTFPDPDREIRRSLWISHLDALAATSTDDPIDVEHLAELLDLAGGDIRNVVLAAAYAAADDAAPVGMAHVMTAAEQEYGKLGRIMPRPVGQRRR